MTLDSLPDLPLLQIFSNCSLEDIESLQLTNRKLHDFVTYNRFYFRKTDIRHMFISMKEDGKLEVIMSDNKDEKYKKKTTIGLLNNDFIKSVNPYFVSCCDHEDLVKMSPMWWKDRERISLYEIIDYRKYLPYFDRCTEITLFCHSPKNLKEILDSMKTKNLSRLSLIGDGELECTEDDLRKIAKLSNKMYHVLLENLSPSSYISNDAVLDFIENVSSWDRINIFISKIQNFLNMNESLRHRNWVVRHTVTDSGLHEISSTNGKLYYIKSG